jgi:ABC-2 type transport system permease protein
VIPYLAVVTTRFRMLLQYRAAATAGFATQLFWGLMRVMIFEAFYLSSVAEQPLSFSQVVTYIWLGQAFFALLPLYTDPEMHQFIRTGSVVYELLKPVNLYALWFSRSVATKAAPALLRAVPMLILAGLCLGLGPPASLAAGIAWGVATVNALLLSAALTTLLGATMLITISGDGITRIMVACVFVFSGMTIPLPFFPEWAQDLIHFLPFRGLVDVPVRIYSGHIPVSQIPLELGIQAAWIAALVLIGRMVVNYSVKRMVVQGG